MYPLALFFYLNKVCVILYVGWIPIILSFKEIWAAEVFPRPPELKPVWRGSLASGLGAGMAVRAFSWLPELWEAVRPQTGCLNHPRPLLPSV